MHGLLGYVEGDAGAAARMSRWLGEWIEIAPAKESFAIERAPFRCLASREPGGGEEPTAGGDDGPLLAWWGFIARDQLADGGPEPTTDGEIAEVLLRRYRKHGAEALVGLNGRYLAVVYDPAERRLELMNDVLGLMPVFLWRSGGSFAFASNVWAIARHPAFRRAVDVRGLADLLMLSCQQGTRTLHEDVSVLPPGSVTTFQDGEFNARSVDALRFSDERWDRSVEQVADEMHARLERSAERRLPSGRLRLPLSGGFDSRVMLGLLAERPADVRAVTQFTYGWYTEDMRYARHMARRAAVRHDVVPLPDDFMAAHRERCVAINGGLYDAHTARYLSLFYRSGGEAIPTISGHLGGELTGRFLNSAATAEPPEERFQVALGPINECRFPPEEARGLLLEDLVDDRLAEAREAFLSFDGPAFQQFAHFDLTFYRRRFISFQLFYMQQFAPIIAPFYDRDFVDLMCSVPHAALERQRAYRDMICRRFPALARVPNTNDLPLATSTAGVLKTFLATQWRRFARRPLQRVLHLRRWVPHPNVQFGYALRGASRGVLEHVMGSRDRLAPYLDVDRLGVAVERQLAGDSSWVNGLLAVSSFATALEMLEDPERALIAARPPQGEGRA